MLLTGEKISSMLPDVNLKCELFSLNTNNQDLQIGGNKEYLYLSFHFGDELKIF